MPARELIEQRERSVLAAENPVRAEVVASNVASLAPIHKKMAPILRGQRFPFSNFYFLSTEPTAN